MAHGGGRGPIYPDGVRVGRDQHGFRGGGLRGPALTTSSGPGFSLMQEGISYLCADEVPCVLANVMRIGSGLGDIFQGQGDYWQLTRGGGHGDYRTIVLAPSGVQETCDLAYGAFDLAEKYRASGDPWVGCGHRADAGAGGAAGNAPAQRGRLSLGDRAAGRAKPKR